MRILLLLLAALGMAQSALHAQVPTITNQPASQAAQLGGNAYFAVGVSGAGPITYQWQFNGTNLPDGIITTVAGPSDGVGSPRSVAMDAAGNLFIADTGYNQIRRVDTSGIMTIVAGNGSAAYAGDGGLATNASLNFPWGVAVDAVGNVFIGDLGNYRIRKVSPNGIITTVAGNGTSTASGDGGQGTNATLSYPDDVALDAAGNLFLVDNMVIRKLSTNGIITRVAGSYNSDAFFGDGGQATNASFWNPYGVTVDATGNLFIGDTANNRIRKVSTNGIITTVAGSGPSGGAGSYGGDGGQATNASLNLPSGVAADASGNLFIADNYNNRVRRVGSNGIITTVAGIGPTSSSGSYAGDGGAATNASLNGPSDVVVDAASNLFIADLANNRIRKVTNTRGPRLALNNVTAADAGNYRLIVTGSGGSVTSSVVVLAVGAPVSRDWNGSAGSDWFNAANWTPGGVPGPYDTVNISNGVINLTSPVTHSGPFNWSGGTLSGYSLTIATNGVLNISASVILACGLTNAGTVNWLGGTIYVQNSSTVGGSGLIVNLPGGAWNIQCDQEMYDPNASPVNPFFRNAGTVAKQSGANTTSIGIPFYDLGTASVLAGTLNLTNGATVTGALSAALGTTIAFSGGSFAIGGGATNASVTAAQQILIGNITNSPAQVTIYTNGGMFVTNASQSAYVDVRTNGSLTLGGGVLRVDNLILTNGGTFTNLAGALISPKPYQIENGSSLIVNGGSITTSTNFTLGTVDGSTGTLTVANGGTLNIINSALGVGDNGSITNGSGTGSVTVSNGTLAATAITLGSTAGGLGSLAIQANGTVTVGSNLTAVSSSLSTTSIVSVAGGTLAVSNGIIALGPTGCGLMTIDNLTIVTHPAPGQSVSTTYAGSVTAQAVKLGGAAASTSGALYLNSGQLRTRSLSCNFILVGGGDLDGSGGIVIIGEDHASAMAVSAGSATNIGTLFVGYTPGFTGTFTQSGGSVIVNTNLILGVSNSTGVAVFTGGELYVTNAAHTATLEVRQGSFLMTGGKLVVDTLIATNGGVGTFNRAGGTLTYRQLQQSAGGVSAVSGLVLDGGASAGVGAGTFGGATALYVTNAAHNAVLNTLNGAFVLGSGGMLVVDTLVLTNAPGHFFKTGGTLVAGNIVLAPDLDADTDGQSNTNELMAGTDALDASSHFDTLSATLVNGRDIRVGWTAVGGHSYVVQRSTNSLDGPLSFVDLSPLITVPGTGPGATNYVHVGGATNRGAYYRVRLGP